MFEKNDKRRLPRIMDMYLSGEIDAKTFCDEYYYSYDLEIDSNDLTDLEKLVYSELSSVSSRFSPYPEDHSGLPHGFNTEEELRKKIEETKEKLKHATS